MMQTDVRAISLVATGSATTQRNRLRGIVVAPGATAGSIVVSDGATGPVLFNIPTTVNGSVFDVEIPGEGILCLTGIYVTLTNVLSATVFYS